VTAALRVEDRADGLRVLTLVNPARRNALDDGQVAALQAALALPAGTRAVLVRGEGGPFCAGYDLSQLGTAAGGILPDDALMAALLTLEQCTVPTVALVEGVAYGAGFDLACACDFRIGGPSARFCMPPARLGIVYSAEGVARLSRLVGPARAKWLMLTAETLGADAALTWGLLDALTPDAEPHALALCQRLARQAPLAVAGLKQTFQVLARGPASALDGERLRALRTAAFQSEDAREGRAAFLEKRPPLFLGR